MRSLGVVWWHLFGVGLGLGWGGGWLEGGLETGEERRRVECVDCVKCMVRGAGDLQKARSWDPKSLYQKAKNRQTRHACLRRAKLNLNLR